MENKKECPIDHTALSPFNQYELQDATICRGCAKKIGLIGAHQSLTLANAAKALLTLSVANEYSIANKKVDYKKLKSEYKSAVKSGDAPTGYQMFKATTSDASNKNITTVSDNDSSKVTKNNDLSKLNSDLHEQPIQNSAAPSSTTIINNQTIVKAPKKVKRSHNGLTCPHCGSANVQLINSDANTKKEKKSISLNLNPLHPLTPFRVKTKKVKKRSKTKMVAAIATGGSSMLLTGGTRSNKTREYHCQECGKTFLKK